MPAIHLLFYRASLWNPTAPNLIDERRRKQGDAQATLPLFAFRRLANREQEDGTLVLCVWREEFSHIIVEKGQSGCTQMLGISSQVDPAADGARLQLDRAVAAVSVSFQDSF